MIELKEIKRINNIIACKAFVEDCTTEIPLQYDFKTRELSNYTLPEGYGWCNAHIGYAERYMEEQRDVIDVPEHKVIMW